MRQFTSLYVIVVICYLMYIKVTFDTVPLISNYGGTSMRWPLETERECPVRCRFGTNFTNADAVWFDANIFHMKKPPPFNVKFLVDGESRHKGKNGNKITIHSKEWLSYKSLFDYHISCSLNDDAMYLFSRTIINENRLFTPVAPLEEKENVVVFINSNCNTMSKREKYVRELSKFVTVKSYGKCLHNTEWVPSLEESTLGRDRPKLMQKYPILRKAKFCIAMENSVVKDYNSEKLWESMASGCIPIYLGDNRIRDFLPAPYNEIYIDVNDYQMNMSAVANKLTELMRDDNEYNEFMKWKSRPPLSGYLRWKEVNRVSHYCRMCMLYMEHSRSKT